MAYREKVIEELQKAKEILCKVEEPTFWLDFVQDALRNAIELLKEQEAVVRCKDCALLSDGKCKWWDIIPRSDDWFCADGERR